MKNNPDKPIVIIGAGMAGIAAAVFLSAQGLKVIVLEKEAAAGGKMRLVEAGGEAFDAGPTVMTMKWVFDELLAHCQTELSDEVTLTKSQTLARHYWSDGEGLDLFAKKDASAEAIAQFSNQSNADGYLRFCEDSAAVFETLKRSYIAASMPGPIELTRRIGFFQPKKLLDLKPFSTLWSALGGYFEDERLRQLFGRYATYCGSSPFSAPATLMLVAHVEQDGVWQVAGGMKALAQRLTQIAIDNGAEFRFGKKVVSLKIKNGVCQGVMTSEGEIKTDHIIFNGDVSALADMAENQKPISTVMQKDRSLSALVSCMVAKPEGRPLAHHTVFFGDDYKREFDSIFRDQSAPDDPTVYVCAQDRTDAGRITISDENVAERLYLLMNMPANGDKKDWSKQELKDCFDRCIQRLEKSGLKLSNQIGEVSMTGPSQFDGLFPGSGGALYGRASHGWMASFKRQGSRTKIGGLYLAGGSVHPGPGVPMAALSGRLAGEELISDLNLI